MRSDDALFLDMLIAARKIRQFIQGVSQERFQANDMMQSAILREIQVIGEAARMITEEAKAERKEVPWHALAGMRNRIVHAYFSIDLQIVWDTATQDMPALIEGLERILSDDSGQKTTEDKEG
jgi:uncharacterized protein with HEPN domain